MSTKKSSNQTELIPQDEKSNDDQLAEKLKTDLVVFDPIKAEATKLIDQYSKLEIKNAFDKTGLETVKAARMDLVKRRTAGERARKGLVDSAVKYQKVVNQFWNGIELMLTGAESKLKEKETFWENERIRLDKLQYDTRVNRLSKFGMIQNSTSFIYGPYYISFEDVKNYEDPMFDRFVQEVEIEFDKVEAEKLFLSDWDQAISENNRITAEQLKKEKDEVDAKLKALQEKEDQLTPPRPTKSDPVQEQFNQTIAPLVTAQPDKHPGGFVKGGFVTGNVSGGEWVAPVAMVQPKEREFLLSRSEGTVNYWKVIGRDKDTGANIQEIATLRRVEKEIHIEFKTMFITFDDLIKVARVLHVNQSSI